MELNFLWGCRFQGVGCPIKGCDEGLIQRGLKNSQDCPKLKLYVTAAL